MNKLWMYVFAARYFVMFWRGFASRLSECPFEYGVGYRR